MIDSIPTGIPPAPVEEEGQSDDLERTDLTVEECLNQVWHIVVEALLQDDPEAVENIDLI
jgi:hypothetical protein